MFRSPGERVLEYAGPWAAALSGASRPRCAVDAQAVVVPSGQLCLHLSVVPFPSQFDLALKVKLKEQIIPLSSGSVMLCQTQEAKGTTD